MKWLGARIAVGVMLLLGSAHSRAASTAPASRPATKPTPPHVIFSEIATSSENAAIEIRGIESGLSSDPVLPHITANLPSLSDEIDARIYEAASLLQANPSLETLRTLDQDWNTLHEQLKTWKKQLAERRDWTAAKTGDLNYGISLWEGSDQIATPETVSRNDRERITDTLSSMKDTLKDVEASQKQIEAMYSKTDEQEARVGYFLSDLNDARTQAYNRLLERDAAPLWNLSPDAPGKPVPADAARVSDSQHSFAAQLNGVTAYLRRNGGRFFPHVLVLFATYVALLWLRRRVRQRVADNPQLAEAEPIFQAPLSTALVIWFMIAIWIYPHAPRLFWAVAGALALIPTVVLLRGLVAKKLLPLLTALVVFYFVDQVRIVLAPRVVLSRWLFLMEMVAALLAMIFLLRSKRTDDAPAGSVWIGRLIRGASWLAAVVLAATILGDVIGYVSLARLLGDGVLRSAYLGLILYAALRIADALLVLAFYGRPLSLLKVVREHRAIMLVRTRQAFQWIALALWALFVLQLFWIHDIVFGYIREALATPLHLGRISITPRNVIEFGVTIWASVLLSRFVRFVLEEDVYDRFSLPTGIPYAISKVLNYVILLTGFFMALGALGVPLTNFALLASAFTVGIGFGLQNIVNNFVSGIILLFERPVKVGDVVQLDDAAGVVGQIGIRASVIRTMGGAEVIVPNAMFISSRVTNWTLSNSQRKIDIEVAVAAGPRPQDVIDLLQNTASGHPLVGDSPRPIGMLTKFTGDTYSYELHAWTERVESWQSIRSDLTVALSDALAKANIAVR